MSYFPHEADLEDQHTGVCVASGEGATLGDSLAGFWRESRPWLGAGNPVVFGWKIC